MFTRALCSGTALWLAGMAPAAAEDPTALVIGQLNAQGYLRVVATRTLLGRQRIVADGPVGAREIVLDPRTGEILRDFWMPATGGADNPDPAVPVILDRPAGAWQGEESALARGRDEGDAAAEAGEDSPWVE